LAAVQPQQQWFSGKQPRAGAPASVVQAQHQVQPDADLDLLSRSLTVLHHPMVDLLSDRDKQQLILCAATKYIESVFATSTDQPSFDSERVERHQIQQERFAPYARDQGYAPPPQWAGNAQQHGPPQQQFHYAEQQVQNQPPRRGGPRRS
jgi:hypothetical protein